MPQPRPLPKFRQKPIVRLRPPQNPKLPTHSEATVSQSPSIDELTVNKTRAWSFPWRRSQEPLSPPPRPRIFTRIFSFLPTVPTPIRRILRVIRILAPIVPMGIFFSEHIAQIMWVRGPSMTPYLNEGYEQTNTNSDMVLVNLFPFSAGIRSMGKKRTRLERGMIVTFRSPANPNHIAIKRIIGLPGDRIITREPCLKHTQIVPFNHIWVEGDAEDPSKSLDSNTYGPVSVNLITGRVEAVLWPRPRWLRWTDWENGADADADADDQYREEVRKRVVKEAVKLHSPAI